MGGHTERTLDKQAEDQSRFDGMSRGSPAI